MKQINIGTETIREIVHGEQYTVRPLKKGFFMGDCDDPYEIVISHNGEEWTVYARTFSTRVDETTTEEVLSPEQYFDMLPAIKAAFGFQGGYIMDKPKSFWKRLLCVVLQRKEFKDYYKNRMSDSETRKQRAIERPSKTRSIQRRTD